MGDNDSRIDVAIGAKLGDLQNGLNQAADAIKKFGKEGFEGIEHLNKSIAGLGAMAAVFTEFLVIGEVGKMIIETAMKTAEYAEQMDKASQKTGIAVDTLQELKAVAELSDVSFQSVVMSMRRLSMAMTQAQQGSSEYIAAFRQVGISSAELRDMKPEDVILKIADAYKNHADGAEKVANAQKLLGRGGMELIPFFNQGAEGIDEMTKKAREMGAVMSEEDMKAAKELKEQTEQLSLGMSAISRNIGSAFVPVLTKLVGYIKDNLKITDEWKQSLSIIGKTLATVFMVGVEIVQVFWEVLKFTITNAINLLEGLGEMFIDLVTGNFKKLVEDGKMMWNIWNASARDAFTNIVNDAKKNAGVIKSIWTDEHKGETESKKSENKKKLDSTNELSDKLKMMAINHNRDMALADLERESQYAQHLLRMGDITAEQEIEKQKEIEERKREVIKDANQQLLDISNMTNIEKKKLRDQDELDEKKHQTRIVAMDQKTALEMRKHWLGLYDSITAGFTGVVKGLVDGTMTWTQAFKNMQKIIIDSLVDMFAKMVFEKLKAAIFGQVTEMALARSKVAAEAAVAGAAATASAASNPVTLPAAPEIGMATYASAMSFQAMIPAAAGGFDIPAGVNPLTQLHQREMVLPAHLADKVRGMTEGGTTVHNWNISAVDAYSMKRFIRRLGPDLADSLARQKRNFKA